jgi:hypothetical protein
MDIDPVQLQAFIAKRRDAQNFGFGVLGGIIGAVIGAALWGGITAATDGRQIGFMAIGVGFLVGFGVRTLGKGIDKIFGVAGAVLSLAGCVAGNLLAVMIIYANQQNMPFAELAARMTPSAAWSMLTETFNFMDVIFYGIALYFGYTYSFHKITPEELQALRPAPAAAPAAEPDAPGG